MPADLIMLLLLLGVLASLLGLLWLFWQGPPYLPTKSTVIEEMVALAGIKRGTKVAELGAGDGRLAIALARAGAVVDGYEINPLLVLAARRRARRAGVTNRVRFFRRNFWKVDYSRYEAVTVFGIPHVMERLGKKLARELPKGARVVSNAFPIPGLGPAKRSRRALRYLIR